jgi:hypothetical protein
LLVYLRLAIGPKSATYVFDQLALIFKKDKWPNCLLSKDNITYVCLHFREVFVLLDGIFLLERTNNLDDTDISTYLMFATSAVKRHADLKWAITPKVHFMLKHVKWQIKNIRGGWEIKEWRIGLSTCTKMVCANGGTFRQTRTLRSMQRQERMYTYEVHMLI